MGFAQITYRLSGYMGTTYKGVNVIVDILVDITSIQLSGVSYDGLDEISPNIVREDCLVVLELLVAVLEKCGK